MVMIRLRSKREHVSVNICTLYISVDMYIMSACVRVDNRTQG
jgi:hypothetical protein